MLQIKCDECNGRGCKKCNNKGWKTIPRKGQYIITPFSRRQMERKESSKKGEKTLSGFIFQTSDSIDYQSLTDIVRIIKELKVGRKIQITRIK